MREMGNLDGRCCPAGYAPGVASGQGLTELRVLGHMEVVVHGERVEPPGPKPRALLALLALHAGEVVSLTRAADALWDAGAPAGEAQALQTHVSRLRKALRGGAEVRSRPPGYVLACDPQRIDAIRFTTRVAEARRRMRDGDHAAARRDFDAALIWAGVCQGGSVDRRARRVSGPLCSCLWLGRGWRPKREGTSG